jgi:hypothetical protein
MLRQLGCRTLIIALFCSLLSSVYLASQVDSRESTGNDSLLVAGKEEAAKADETHHPSQTDESKDGQKSATNDAVPNRVDRDLSPGWTASTKNYNLAQAEGTHFKEHSESKLELAEGELFLEALKPVVIVTPLAEYHLKAKSLCYLHVKKGNERILALLEGATVVSHKRSTEVRFGEEAVLTEHSPSHNDVVGEHGIGIRQLRTHPISSNRHLSIAEFSLIQATERVPLMSKIIHSGHAHDKAIKTKLIKCAAVLNMVTSRHGGYAGGH